MKTPRIPDYHVELVLAANGIPLDKVAVLAIRGYYLDTMGEPGENDRGIYDDAMAIWSPRGVLTFQANTDPSGYRKGRGTGDGKGMACLVPGIHRFGTGLHRGHPAFRQVEPFTVIRDGSPPYRDTGWFAIDLHSGGHGSTSSAGCQTVPASTWPGFQPLLYSLLREFDNPLQKNDRGELVHSFDYCLIEEEQRRATDLIVSRRYLGP